ncbi:MAG: hypothetical protein ACKO96_10965, partial [Flammeovirgaceae bacterium]
ILFSDKYEPLFHLIQSWEKVTENDFENEQEKKYYTDLSEVHTVCISGGRDSGKTFAGGIFNTVAVADYGHRILYTRYTLSSADNSIEQAQQNRIELLGLRPEFNITNKSFEHKKN